MMFCNLLHRRAAMAQTILHCTTVSQVIAIGKTMYAETKKLTSVIASLISYVMRMIYSKTCVKRPLSKRPKIGFQDQYSLNAGQKYCRMLLLGQKYFRMLQVFCNTFDLH